ncbi:MAG: tRNA (guanosine(46)-N7)-methyltransferase TrmB [Bacilli bacterium]
MRLRNKPWAKDFCQENSEIVIQDAKDRKGKWSDQFANKAPIYLEIGTGRGGFIVEMAKRNPEINFIGIEKFTSVIVDVVAKIKEEGVTNVLLLNEDATNLLDFFEPNEIHQLFLNFSDPWPKDRHAKRRLTHENFLKQYEVVLVPDGVLQFKTDNRELFEFSLVSFSGYGAPLEEVQLDLHKVCDESNVMTEYEAKFSAKGNPIYRSLVTLGK